jgi:ligand-binding sensor domain-containing protein/anti-sigma regulatory factor (Ser/Thr protein kinase)
MLVALVTIPLNAQVFRHFTKANGMQGNGVYRLCQDASGFIWLNSPDGISRFDGNEFTHFNLQNGLPQNDIWYLMPDNHDRIWYFTKANRLGYLKNDEVFSFKKPDKSPFYPQHYYQADTLIAFYSRNPSDPKYYYFKEDKWFSLPIKRELGHYVDINRKYFYHFKENNLRVVDSTGEELLTITDLNKEFEEDKKQINDRIFIYSFDNKILYINTQTLSYKIHQLPKTFKTGRITYFNHQIQVSYEEQLLVFDEEFNLLDTYAAPEKIEAIFHFLDRDKNLWVATLNDGLYFYPKINRELEILFPDKIIKDLSVFNQQLFIQTDLDGYFRLSPHSSHPEKFLDADAIGQINVTLQGKKLTITNKNQLYTQQTDEKSGMLQAMPHPGLTVLEHHKGNWFNVGLSNLILSDNFKKIEDTLYFDASKHIKATKNQLFVGGIEGLKIWQKSSFIPFRTNDSLHQATITHLSLLNENQLLVGTENEGLFLVNESQSKKIWDTDGEIVIDAFAENENSIWLVTNTCLMHLQSNNFWLEKNIQQDTFCHPFLLLKNGLNAVAVIGQKLYLASQKGLIALNYKNVFEIPESEFYVKSLNFNQQDFASGTQFPYQPANSLNLKLGTLQFLPHKPNRYQYRLLPIQNQWITLEENNLTLSGFEPDSYILQLRQEGLTNSEKAYNFEIIPKWWQNKWFFVFLFLLAIALTTAVILAIVKNRYEQKEKRMNQLRMQTEHQLQALRSQMNPHFIFNSLNAIQYYLNSKGPELSEKYLIDFSKLIRIIFEFSDKKTVNLSEEIRFLQLYLEVEKMRFGEKLSYHIHTDPKLNKEQWKIPSLLLQPIVENAVNHGIFHSNKLGLVSIKFNKKNEQKLEVVIEDNGVGMDKTRAIYENSLKKHTSKSTQILQSRIDLLNQTKQFYIEYSVQDLGSKLTSGTRVTLYISPSKN